MQQTPVTSGLGAVDFIDDCTGWVVGSDGVVVHSSDGGATWSQQSTGTTERLRDVVFVDSANGWAVGDSGVILHTSNGGSSWQQQTSISAENLDAVSFVDTKHGWIVGPPDSVLHTSDGGKSWSEQPLPKYVGVMKAVAFVDSKTGWAGGWGNTGHIFKTVDGGSTWVHQPTKQLTVNAYHTMFALDANNVWALGGPGFVYTSCYESIRSSNGGATWQGPTQGFQETWIRDVSFANKNDGWAVPHTLCAKAMPTADGCVAYTNDGGVTWNAQPAPSHFNSIDFIDANTGWAVGGMGRIYHTTNGGHTGCDDSGPSEPANDKEATAVALAADNKLLGVIDGAGDSDWFKTVGYDEFGSIVKPRIRNWSQLNLRTCIYLDCHVGKTVVSCPEGTSVDTSPDGHNGCCSNVGTRSFSVGLNCTGTISEDADVTIRIDGSQAAQNACIAYEYLFNYNQ